MTQQTEKVKSVVQKASKWSITHIKGLSAILGGIVLIYAFKISIIYIIPFMLGAFLIYYGFAELKVTPVTDFIDNVIKKIRQVISKK
jgi:uncharacterized membrane protein HdeD (DUF308 family)